MNQVLYMNNGNIDNINNNMDNINNNMDNKTPKEIKEGYVFIAYGQKYLDQAIHLVKTIKLFDPKRQYILISNLHSNEFNSCIDISHEFQKEQNNHNKYCVLARIMTPLSINLDRFLMIDTDIVCMNNIHIIWDTFKSTGNCFNCIGGRDGSKWHWGFINSINSKLNTKMKPMHGGLIYFDKTHTNFNQYIHYLMEAYQNYDAFGFKRFFRKTSMTDEILFSYASDKLGILPHDFIKFPFVSFCLSDNHHIHKKIVTWGTKDTTFEPTIHPTILNHFTGLNDGPRVDKLYNSWIRKIDQYYIKMNHQVTGVTALININREQRGDGRKWSDYIKWFQTTLKLNIPMVIFCEQDTYNQINHIRNQYPLTKFIIIQKKDIHYLKYTQQVNQIAQNSQFLSKIMGRQRLEIKLPIYNLIIMNKFKWLKEAASKNYFGSNSFLWIDAGCSRFFEQVDMTKPFPLNPNKLITNKINIQIRKTLLNKKLLVDNMIYHCDHYTTATVFGGNKNIINWIDEKISEAFKWMLAKNCINNEQILMGIVYKNNLEKFHTFLNTTNKHVPYFQYLTK